MTGPEPAGRGPGLRAEIKDAVSLRAFLLVCGVALLQLGFIASYIGAFHHPEPHRVPIAVLAPAAVMPKVLNELNSLPGAPLRATPAVSAAAGGRQLDNQKIYGLLEINDTAVTDQLAEASASGPSAAAAVTAAVRAAEARSGRRILVTDIRPPAAGDHNGLSSFYLVVGWIVGGYLVAAILGISAGSRPENLNRTTIRFGAIAAYAIITGLAGSVIVGPWLHALPTHSLSLWMIGTLLVFAAGAVTTALMVVAGTIGIGLTILVFVVIGNPSAGGAYAWPLLPAFWRDVGPWIPTGAGTSAVRGIAYFNWDGIGTSLLVIAGYALAGLVVSYAVLAVTGRPLLSRPAEAPAPVAAAP